MDIVAEYKTTLENLQLRVYSCQRTAMKVEICNKKAMVNRIFSSLELVALKNSDMTSNPFVKSGKNTINITVEYQ